MLIQNNTTSKEYQIKGERPAKIIIQSLKTRPEDEEIMLNMEQIVDTAMYVPHWDDDRILNNPELKRLEEQKAIKFLKEYPKEPTGEEKKKIEEKMVKSTKDEKLLDIKSTDNLTNLQDIVKDEKDIDMVRAAVLRLQELEGDIIDAPEIKEGSNTPIA